MSVPDGYSIQVTFQAFDIEQVADCGFDYIQFCDQQGKNCCGATCSPSYGRGIPILPTADPALNYSFSPKMLELVHQLHLMDLIHADLKPDNFLVVDFPGLHNRALQMIDFGKALDMRLVRELLIKGSN